MWCGLIFGLLAIVAGIRMIKKEEGPDLRHKHLGSVSGQQAVTQGKTAVILGIFVIIFCIALIILQNP